MGETARSDTTTASLIMTRFGGSSTTTDVLAGVDLAGRRAVVTGATSGLGAETARALASAGAEVTLAVRDTLAGVGGRHFEDCNEAPIVYDSMG